jgi:hypothetical protein
MTLPRPWWLRSTSYSPDSRSGDSRGGSFISRKAFLLWRLRLADVTRFDRFDLPADMNERQASRVNATAARISAERPVLP